jgi:hypothetical protein
VEFSDSSSDDDGCGITGAVDRAPETLAAEETLPRAEETLQPRAAEAPPGPGAADGAVEEAADDENDGAAVEEAADDDDNDGAAVEAGKIFTMSIVPV